MDGRGDGLEGPGTEARLRRLKAGFRRTSRLRHEAESRKLFRIGVVVVFLLTLVASWFVVGWLKEYPDGWNNLAALWERL